MGLKTQINIGVSQEELGISQCDSNKWRQQIANGNAGLQQLFLRKKWHLVLHHQKWSLLRIILSESSARTRMLEQLFTLEAWGAVDFFIVEEKHLEHCMIIGAMTGSHVALCMQMSMLNSNEWSTCIFSKWLRTPKFFYMERNRFSWKGWRPFSSLNPTKMLMVF